MALGIPAPQREPFVDPPPGPYAYFVRNFSGTGALGASDVVVRVIVDDAPAGEFRPARSLATDDWMPFKGLIVGEDGRVTIVPFTPEEIVQGLDGRDRASFPIDPCLAVGGLVVVGAGFVAAVSLRRRRRRR